MVDKKTARDILKREIEKDKESLKTCSRKMAPWYKCRIRILRNELRNLEEP
jgi:hypothetical protein